MDRSWMYKKQRNKVSYIQELNGFIEAAKRHALIKQTKDIYCPIVTVETKKCARIQIKQGRT